MATILVIEDNLEILENFEELLESENYQVVTATNGKVGIRKLDQLLPDLIISDIMMPEMDGYEVLEKLHNHAETSTIPFIFLTAKAEKAEKKMGLDLGADDYLIKPVSAEVMLDSIKKCLQKKKNLVKKFNNQLDELDDYFRSRRNELLDLLSENQYRAWY